MPKRKSASSTSIPQTATAVNKDTKRHRGDCTAGTGSTMENSVEPTPTLLISSFTTPKQPSILEEGMYVEIIDSEIVKTLLNSDVLKRGASEDDTEEVWAIRKRFNLVDESVQLTKLRDTKGVVLYKGTPTGYGRVFAKKGLSIALLRKRVRHTLCASKYVDWDMVNAHPVILFQLLKKNYPDNPELWTYQQKYCVDRDEYLNKVTETHGVEKKTSGILIGKRNVPESYLTCSLSPKK